jgi:hypothetical protein
MSMHLRKPLFALLLLLIALPGIAQTHIDKVPAAAALYVGWRGSADMGPGYEGSNLQGMLEEIGLLDAVPELAGIIDQLSEEGKIEGEEAEMLGLASTLATSAWSQGFALYVLPPDPQGPPIPRACMIWNEGDNADELTQAIDTAAAILEEELPILKGELDGARYLAVGFDPTEINAEPLSGSDRFKAAVKHVQRDAALTVYADLGELIRQVDGFTQMMQQQAEDEERPLPPFVQLWPVVSEASGLRGIESVAMTAGLLDKNWHTRMFLGAPAPRTGFLSLLDNGPLRSDDLLHIPKTATYAQMFSMQPSRVLDVATDVAGKIDPNIVRSIQETLKEASEAVGFDVEMKLIRGMGPQWSLYVDPMIAGNGFASIVMTNDLQDADAVQFAMLKLSQKANELFAEEDEVKIRFLTQDVGETAVTHLGIPLVAPAWAIHNNRLYVALFPQAIEMAIEQSGKREDSILGNAAFQASFARFLDEPGQADNARAFDNLRPITGLSFTDLPETATEGYGMAMMLMQVVSGGSEMLTGEPSAMRMPPVGKIMQFLEPASGVTRVDSDGLHIHLVEPFPGASLFGVSKGATSGAGFTAPAMVGVMLPALGASRRTARIMQTTTQARMLSMANFTYAADNKGVYADDIAKLEDYLGNIEMLISPQSIRGEWFDFNFAELPDAKRAEQIRRVSSFILVPLGDQDKLQNASDTVMLFERPDDTDNFEVAVAMADGASFRIGRDELAEMLQKQTGKTVEQLIQRQVNFGK